MSVTATPCPTRRTVVAGVLAIGSVPRLAYAADAPRLVAGTYANEHGPGLVSLKHEQDAWFAGASHPTIRNASFGVISRKHRLHYLLNEQAKGMLGIYDAALRRITECSTMGADPCHIALAPNGKLLATANYSSGSVVLWTLNPATGRPFGSPQLVEHKGHGPNTERQAGAHAHWVGFTADSSILHSVDLGADAVFAHHIDRSGSRIVDTAIAFRADAGSGPRHLVRHPRLPTAYLIAELANTISVLRGSPDGIFHRRAVLSTLPKGFHGSSFAAHLAMNAAGTHLYASNRGHDSIAVYAVGSDGDLSLQQHVACGGHWPRFFKLMEEQGEMLVANERSGGIARLPLKRDGLLGAASTTTAIPGVAFITE